MGFPTNSGRRILEAGDSWGDEVASAAEVTGDGGGLVEDVSPRPDMRALLTLLRGIGDGARGSSGTASGTGDGTRAGTGAGAGEEI